MAAESLQSLCVKDPALRQLTAGHVLQFLSAGGAQKQRSIVMGRNSYQRRLATRFTHSRLSTNAGTIFVPPHPVDLEAYFGSDDALESPHAAGLTAFERLVDAERYQLILSLSWGGATLPSHTLDLGLLRVDGDKLFVVHQLNDDAGTSLILAYLCADTPSRLFSPFLVDYLSSGGTAYMVTLPCRLPENIWIVQPEVASHPVVAVGLLGLVAPGGFDGGLVHPGVGTPEQYASQLPFRPLLVA
jgi:hypothetical protein